MRLAQLRGLAHEAREVGELVRHRQLVRVRELGPLVGRQVLAGLDAEGRRLAQDRAEPRVAVLDVEDGVVHRVLLGELDVELDVRVGGSRQEEEPQRVGPRSLAPGPLVDLVHHLVDRDEVAGALAALDRDATLRDEHELVEDRLEPIERQTQRSHRVLQAR